MQKDFYKNISSKSFIIMSRVLRKGSWMGGGQFGLSIYRMDVTVGYEN
jgi:hypothetical protein